MLRFNSAQNTDFFLYIPFQYILCYGSTNIEAKIPRIAMNISIHPMLRFNYDSKNSYCTSYAISIHPMLRFNVTSTLVFKNLSKISIHPMLRFNRYNLNFLEQRIKFQYILCYGSTLSAYH